MSTNAQLSAQFVELLQRWNDREAELRGWLAGAPGGGPNSDGRFPLTDAGGQTVLCLSPSALADMVEGPAAASEASRLLSEAARDTALGHRNAAADSASLATASKVQAIAARDLALTYRDQIAAQYLSITSQSTNVGELAEQVEDNTFLVEGMVDEVWAARDLVLEQASRITVGTAAAPGGYTQAQVWSDGTNIYIKI